MQPDTTLISYLSSQPWLIVLLVWSVIWKLIAMWKAAKHDQLTMFIVIAIINTAGLLEIGYMIYLWKQDKKAAELEDDSEN